MVLPFSVNALEEEPRYEASLKFYKVDEEYEDFFYSRKLKNGWVTSVYLKNEAIEVGEDDVLKSGDIIAVATIVKLIDGKIPDAVFLNINYKYDTNIFESKKTNNGNIFYYTNVLSSNEGGAFPYNESWEEIAWEDYIYNESFEDGIINVNFRDKGNEGYRYFNNNKNVAIFLKYLKVKNNISGDNLESKIEYLETSKSETMSISFDDSYIAHEKIMKFNNAALNVNGLISNNNIVKRNGNKELNEIVLDNNVMPLSDTLIKSYEIVRNSDEDYVIGIDPYTTVSTFINSFVNESDYLNVYDFNGNLVSDLNQYVGNGMVMKLEKNGEVLDTLRIIVRGDINGNGRVNWADSLSLDNYIVKLAKFDKYQTLAADITKDGKVNGADQLSLDNYVKGFLKNLN